MPLEKPKKEAHKTWRKEYIRLLTVGPKPNDPEESKEDLQRELDLMGELIDGGYAEGSIIRGETGEIATIMWQGPNTKGRLFVDELEDFIEKKSKRYQLKIASFAVLGWLAGILSAVIIAHLTK